MCNSRNNGGIPKQLIVIILLASILLTWKFTTFNNKNSCKSEASNNYHIISDNHNRFLHSIAKFQVSHSTPGLNLYIYTSFLDERYNKTVLRIFGMEQKGGMSVDFKCKFIEEENGRRVVTDVPAKRYWIDTSWPNWSPYFASEYNCVVPGEFLDFEDTILESVNGKYQIKVPIERPSKFNSAARQKLAVCIKPLTGYQGTYKLVEWIETLKAAGYSHIIVYQSDVTGPGRHILEYYQQKGLVSVINFPYLLSVIQKVEHANRTSQERFAMYQQLYLIAMHDCLYRFSTLYEYLAFHDLDEIILPIRNEMISSMLDRAIQLNPNAAAFTFQTAWHWEEAGRISDRDLDRLYMQQYAKSTNASDGKHPKSIVSTDRSITVNFNEVLDVPKKSFRSISLPSTDYGLVHHFRGRCDSRFAQDTCKTMLKTVKLDNAITRYKTQVKLNLDEVVTHMQMM